MSVAARLRELADELERDDNTRRAPQGLAAFLEENDVSLRAAAVCLHVSHVTVVAWRDGRLIPSDAHKHAIEKWSKGAVRFADWLTASERSEREALANVRPFEPTGTDGH